MRLFLLQSVLNSTDQGFTRVDFVENGGMWSQTAIDAVAKSEGFVEPKICGLINPSKTKLFHNLPKLPRTSLSSM